MARSAHRVINSKAMTAGGVSHNDQTNTIYAIWLGSTLSSVHLQRLLQRKKLNPTNEVILWTENDFQQQIEAQFQESKVNVQVKNIAILNIPEPIGDLLQSLSNNRKDDLPINQAARSDVLRILILFALKTLFSTARVVYVDVDIQPRELNSLKFNPDFNFLVLTDDEDRYEDYRLSPAMIAIVGNHNILPQILLSVLGVIAPMLIENYIKLIRSKDDMLKRLATVSTTGSILKIALKNMRFAGKLLFHKEDEALFSRNLRLIPADFVLVKSFTCTNAQFLSYRENNWAPQCEDDKALEHTLKTHFGTVLPLFQSYLPKLLKSVTIQDIDNPLKIAVSTNNLNMARSALEDKADANQQDKKRDTTLLHEAATNNFFAMVRLLLTNKANPDRVDAKGLTPLHCALSNRNFAVAVLLLRHMQLGQINQTDKVMLDRYRKEMLLAFIYEFNIPPAWPSATGMFARSKPYGVNDMQYSLTLAEQDFHFNFY